MIQRDLVEAGCQGLLLKNGKLLQLLEDGTCSVGRQGFKAVQCCVGMKIQVLEDHRIERTPGKQRIALLQATLGQAKVNRGLSPGRSNPKPCFL